MRLLLIAPLLGRTGRAPDVFETLGPLLVQAGHDVSMTSDRPNRYLRAAAMAAQAGRRRRTTDVAIVHLYSGPSLVVEDVVSRLAARPVVGVLSGGGFPAFAVRHPRWVTRVLDRFDHLVAPSAYLERWARSVSVTPVSVIPNPLDLTPYPFTARAPVRPKLLWLRAFHPVYDPEAAVGVVEALRDRHPDVHLTMVGADKGSRGAAEAMVRRHGLEEHVTIGGFADAVEKRRLFTDHDVFLNTAVIDNRPLSVLEAAACGLCVVSTDVGGLPDLLTDGASGLLVPPGDPTAMADAVDQVLRDAGLSATLAQGGRLVAEQGQPDRVVEAWQRLLGSLTGARSPAGPPSR